MGNPARSHQLKLFNDTSVFATMEYVFVQHSPSDHNQLLSTPLHTTHDLPLQSTPIKINSVTTEPYTTHHKFRIDSCSAMGEEMKQYILGPMPAWIFLDKFFPLNHLHNLKNTTHQRNCYVTTTKAKTEFKAYKPFVSSLCTVTCFPHSIMQIMMMETFWGSSEAKCPELRGQRTSLSLSKGGN